VFIAPECAGIGAGYIANPWRPEMAATMAFSAGVSEAVVVVDGEGVVARAVVDT
jgi:hypothetical protein